MRNNVGNEIRETNFCDFMTKFIVSFILSSDTLSQCGYITEDDNRDKIDPDKLRNGLDHYAPSSNKAELYEFLARYVRKVYPDTDIKNDLKNNEGFCSLTG
jgi:hypothetical protein